jgi:pyruvate dehydrogenase E1 component beta subunit
VTLPVTIRLVNGAGLGFGAQHSQSVENWFLNIPGLKIVVPGSPADAYGLMRAAVDDDNPVLFFEHKALYNTKGELGPRKPAVLGRAKIVRPGRDVTVVATQLMRVRAEESAERLMDEQIDVEVIDPRTLAPLDLETIGASIDRTGRLLVAQECPSAGSWGASVVAGIVGDRFESLDAAPRLLSSPDSPIPYAGELETEWVPSADRISEAVRQLLEA